MACDEDIIPIKQGEAVTVGLFVEDEANGGLLDLTTFTARLQIRQTESDTVVRDDLITDNGLTGDNGRIILGDGVPPTGSSETEVFNATLTWTSDEATALTLFNGRGIQETYQGVGDLELIDDTGNVTASIRLVFEQTRSTTE